MKIVIMDTGRGTRSATLDRWRERLSLDPDDTVSLLTWHAPAEPLPVQEHLVFGPRLDLRRREPRRSQTAFDTFGFGDAEISRSAMTPEETAEDQGEAADASLGDLELAEQMPEQMTQRSQRRFPAEHDDSDDPEPGAVHPLQPRDGIDNGGRHSVSSTAHLPRHHPDRLRQAARWRANRLRVGARRLPPRTKAFLRRHDSAPVRVLRTTLRLGDGISTQFALAVAASRDVTDVFASADVVIPVDLRSQRAAWVLAQRVPGPDVVVTDPAARRVIAARRAGDLGSRG